jgi:hypothetical protein
MADEFSFSITAYEGFEEEALRLLNENRYEHHTRQHLDWRYLGQKSEKAAAIYWIQSSNGDRVGMAGLIFRPYWVGGRLLNFAVLGDISLNAEFRGRGLAQKLFEFINVEIEKQSIFCAFVMPNVAAENVLTASRWEVRQRLIAFTYLLNPKHRIYAVIKSRTFANIFGTLFFFLANLKLKFEKTAGFSAIEVRQVDNSFDSFWTEFDKEGFVIGDKSVSTLRWRYLEHPQLRFDTYKLMLQDKLIGFIICNRSKDNVCYVYDFLVSNLKYVRSAMLAFVIELVKKRAPDSIRLTLNESHPYSKELLKTGFVRRQPEGVIQTYSPSASSMLQSCDWLIHAGDKDV